MTVQTDTHSVSLSAFMRCADFRRGVTEVRQGKAPDFDAPADGLAYEAGRQFGVIAPRTMQVIIAGRVNPRAMDLFECSTRKNEVLP